MDELRALLRNALHENNHTQAQAAAIMGTSQPQLTRFLSGQIVPSAELTIRLAHYLRIPYTNALHMSGHAEFLALLNPQPPISPAAQQFAALSANAPPHLITLALRVAALILSEK